MYQDLYNANTFPPLNRYLISSTNSKVVLESERVIIGILLRDADRGGQAEGSVPRVLVGTSAYTVSVSYVTNSASSETLGVSVGADTAMAPSSIITPIFGLSGWSSRIALQPTSIGLSSSNDLAMYQISFAVVVVERARVSDIRH